MASILTDIFAAECEVNHDDHARLTEDLAEFDAVLDNLTHTWDRDGRLSPADQLRRMERRLSDAVPRHFATEEKTVLASLSYARPETRPFCKAMKRQHATLQRNWEKLRRMTEELDYSPDVSAAIEEIRTYGHLFSKQMVHHMNSEEKKIAEVTG